MEKHVKPNVPELRNASYKDGRFSAFHTIDSASPIHYDPLSEQEYIVIIVIRASPGFPLVQKGSHVKRILHHPFFPIAREQRDGLVLAFDSRLARQNPQVPGEGGAGLYLWYK